LAVEQQVIQTQGQPRKLVRIAGEKIAQVHRGDGLGMALERTPGRRPGESGHGVP
jgi:hypothetical protein